MEFSFYNVTFIWGLTPIINVVCENKRMIWIFINEYKLYPARVFRFILTTFNNKNYPCIHVRVDEDGAISESEVVTKLLVD